MTDLDRVRALLEKATPGPWEAGGRKSGEPAVWSRDHYGDAVLLCDVDRAADAALIAAAPALLAEMARELEQARTEIAHMKAREEHFARVLRVTDGGTYRHDWTGTIERLVQERDAANAHSEAARAVVEAARGMGSYVCDEPDMSLVESARIVSLRSALARYDDATRMEVSR